MPFTALVPVGLHTQLKSPKLLRRKKLCGILRYRRVLLDSHLSVQTSLREAFVRLSAGYRHYGSNPFRREYRFSHSPETL